MVKRARYAEYKDSYPNYRFELSDDGILLMQCHTDGGSLVWDWKSHDDMSDAFADVAGDREIKLLIHTGTGENYNADWGLMPDGKLPDPPIYDAMPGVKGLHKLDEKAWYNRNLQWNVLDVDVPMISVVNGPCNIHSEVPLMGDIVLASDDAYFQDVSHFPRGQVPGDGQHVIWNHIVGPNRARYLLLTGRSSPRRRRWSGARSTRSCRRTSCSTGRGSSPASSSRSRRSSCATRGSCSPRTSSAPTWTNSATASPARRTRSRSSSRSAAAWSRSTAPGTTSPGRDPGTRTRGAGPHPKARQKSFLRREK